MGEILIIYKDPVLQPLRDQKLEHETTIAQSRSSPWSRFRVANQERMIFIPSFLPAIYRKSWLTVFLDHAENRRRTNTWVYDSSKAARVHSTRERTVLQSCFASQVTMSQPVNSLYFLCFYAYLFPHLFSEDLIPNWTCGHHNVRPLGRSRSRNRRRWEKKRIDLTRFIKGTKAFVVLQQHIFWCIVLWIPMLVFLSLMLIVWTGFQLSPNLGLAASSIWSTWMHHCQHTALRFCTIALA